MKPVIVACFWGGPMEGDKMPLQDADLTFKVAKPQETVFLKPDDSDTALCSITTGTYELAGKRVVEKNVWGEAVITYVHYLWKGWDK